MIFHPDVAKGRVASAAQVVCATSDSQWEAPCRDFLEGRQPQDFPDLQALWERLVHNRRPSGIGKATTPLHRCLLALENPQTLSDWPEELLEGDHFPGFLARLLSWTRLLQALDDAPAHLEAMVCQQLERCEGHLAWLDSRAQQFPAVLSWYWREKARLLGMLGGDPLPWLEKSLRQAAALQQWHEVELVRAFLVDNGEERTPHLPEPQRQRLDLLLEALPALAAAPDEQSLRRTLLENLLSLLPLDSVLWLRKDGDWHVPDWLPREIHPRFSRSLVEECRESQELSWGRPEQLEASRSILLAEVQSVLALPVGPDEVVFAWQSRKQPWFDEEHAEVAQFLVRLAATLQRKLQDSQVTRLHLQEAERLHQQWQTVFDRSPLAMAELEEDGRISALNETFSQIFPEARQGAWASDLLEEQDRAPDRQRLRQLQGCSSQMVRLHVNSTPRWFQVTDWKVPEQPGSFRVLVDIGDSDLVLWTDYLEELNHQLASDLHDGPVQLAAARNLSQPDENTQVHYNELRNCLDAWRSPWLDGSSLESWCQEAFHHHLPDCQGQLQMPPEHWPRPQQQTALRLFMGVLQALRLGPLPDQLQLSFSEQGAEVTWQPATPLPLDGELEDLIVRRMDVSQGRYQLESGRLVLQWG